jgi:hypothetical protein
LCPSCTLTQPQQDNTGTCEAHGTATALGSITSVLSTSTSWQFIMLELEAWLKVLVTVDFDKTRAAVEGLAMEKQSSWVALCTAVRANPVESHGFPVCAEFMPNAQNKPAMTSLEELQIHTNSIAYKQGMESAISTAVLLDNGFSMPWDLRRRQDSIRAALAEVFHKMVIATVKGPLLDAPMASLAPIASAVANVMARCSATSSFVDTVNAATQNKQSKMNEDAAKVWCQLSTVHMPALLAVSSETRKVV